MFRRFATLLVAGAMMIAAMPSREAASQDSLPRRGCCSHHGGESGACCGSTLRCNDGTCSPTCEC
jgi:hypothetical protein